MTFADAFLPAENLYAAKVNAETWGYPRPGFKYLVGMVISHSTHGSIEVLKFTIELHDDLGNPFFYEDLSDFLCDINTQEENLYHWTGYYLKYKNGGYRFTGKLRTLDIKNLL